MKKITASVMSIVFILLSLGGCTNPGGESETTTKAQSQVVLHSALESKNDFELGLYTDKEVYKSDEAINIWASLKYTGSENEKTVWSGEPPVVFSISDGKDFFIEDVVLLVLRPTQYDRGFMYRYDYHKSGGFDENAEDADFWQEFYADKELKLPKGKYTIKVRSDFTSSEDSTEKIGPTAELKIQVKD